MMKFYMLNNSDIAYINTKELVCDNMNGKCTQYYYNEETEQFEKNGTYQKLTDYALDIVASNVDIYDAKNDVYVYSIAE